MMHLSKEIEVERPKGAQCHPPTKSKSYRCFSAVLSRSAATHGNRQLIAHGKFYTRSRIDDTNKVMIAKNCIASSPTTVRSDHRSVVTTIRN
jgi:hypothetical protein